METASIEDLQFELKRINNKYEILERNYKILVDERTIQQNFNTNTNNDFKERELAAKSTELSKSKATISLLKNKLLLVVKALHLQKTALDEIRQETIQGIKDVQLSNSKCYRAVLTKVDFINRSYNINLDDCRESMATLMIEMDGLKQENTKLNMTIGQYKASEAASVSDMDRERGMMQKRFSELCEKIEGLQVVHHETVSKLKQDLQTSNAANEYLKSIIQTLEDNCEAKSIDYGTKLDEITREMQQAMEQNALLQKARSDDQKKLTQLQEQYERAMGLLTSVQSDLDLARRQESALRNELQNNGGEKSELSKKLFSIQQKVAEIESTHSVEIESLSRKLVAVENESNVRRMELSSSQVKLGEAVNRCHELESTVCKFQTSRDALEAKLKSSEAAITVKQTTIDKMQNRITEYERTEQMLRDDKNQMEELTSKYKAEAKSLAEELRRALAACKSKEEETSARIRSLEADVAKTSNSRIEALEELHQQIVIKNEEIDQLKQTIQRECEERTMMIITISELKDQILKLRLKQPSHSASVGTSDGVSSKGVSQSFIDSLVHSVGVSGGGSSVYGMSSGASTGTTFPAIANPQSSRQAEQVAKSSTQEDEEAMSVVWAKNQNRAKKSRKIGSSSR